MRLDDVGQQQAADLGGPHGRAADRRDRVEPAGALPADRRRPRRSARRARSPVTTDKRLTECGYGDWTGRPLKELAKEPLWKVVQGHPSAVEFPGGESMRDMQARALDAVRALRRRRHRVARPGALWVAVSHGDVIKAIIADAAGSHLDSFQRIVVDPGSVSVVSYTPLRPFVVRLNEHGDLSGLVPRRQAGQAPAVRSLSGDAPVGGGAGAGT